MLKAETPDIPDLVAHSAAFGDALRGQLARGYEERGNATVRKTADKLRSGVFATDVGMREGIASGLRLESFRTGPSTGVRIEATDSDLPAERKVMVLAWQSVSWMHPVFGNNDVPVTQHGRPYFPKPEDNRALSTAATVTAMQRAAETLGD